MYPMKHPWPIGRQPGERREGVCAVEDGDALRIFECVCVCHTWEKPCKVCDHARKTTPKTDSR